jgi:glycosyltransferase involved in cell wall biosynthesis
VPQQIPFSAYRVCKKRNVPFGVEIVGDPWDVFAPGGFKHPARILFRHWYSKNLRDCCRDAEATSYVTAAALQRRYPPGAGKFTQGISDVQIEKVVPAHRIADSFRHRPLTFVFVGALNQLYKAQDIIIKSMAIIRKQGLDVRLKMIGDGRHRQELETLAADLGVAESIDFLGQLTSGTAVFEQLDSADLFLLPSRQEGLPRALVEAMSRGLPAIASDVGGIPELLPADCMVKPNDAKLLAAKLSEVVNDPARLERMSSENLRRAKEFTGCVLDDERRRFYQAVHDANVDR